MPKFLMPVVGPWVPTLALCASVYAPLAGAASVRKDAACPTDKLESCRWEITVSTKQSQGRPVVRIDWEKSVVSRHMEKPLARPLACNVDRDFNHQGGGYLKVWFANESEPCDATQMKNPAECGVRFLFDPAAPGPFPIGFEVTASAGKVLSRVENRNSLNLQCGDFRRADFWRSTWNSSVGWDAKLPGDGTFSAN